ARSDASGRRSSTWIAIGSPPVSDRPPGGFVSPIALLPIRRAVPGARQPGLPAPGAAPLRLPRGPLPPLAVVLPPPAAGPPPGPPAPLPRASAAALLQACRPAG